MFVEPGTRALHLRGISARYGDRPVLDRVDLEVASGELVALLGPNGSGKTTMLQVIAGVHEPTAGTIELFGRPLRDWSRAQVARSVAVLPQTTELPEGFRVSEVVNLGRIPHARRIFGADPGDAPAVAAALRDANAEDLVDRPVHELSGGERQRVVMAMALAQEPRVLLLDEPTLHLDLAHQVALVRLLARLRATRGLTVVAVLHDLNIAASLADRVLLLRRGRIVSAGRDGAPVDAGLAREVFGVPVEEARTADGHRVLTPKLTEN